jgi:hypothetical protein
MPARFSSNRKIQPRNTRIVDSAIDGIAATIPLAQEQVTNALEVNGIEAMIYNRLNNGRMCSCSLGTKTKNASPLDEEGNASPEHIHSLLQGQEFSVSINRYGARNTDKPSAPNEVVGKPPTLDMREQERFSDDDAEANELVDDLTPFQTENVLGGVSGSVCAVCYGSGFIGGFNLVNGARIVVDADYPDATYVKASSNHAAFPHEVDLVNGEFQFSLTHPASALSLDSCMVFHGFEPAENLTLLVMHPINSGTWVEFDPANYQTYADGKRRQFKVAGTGVFTHVVFQFNLIQTPVFIEYPKLSLTGDLTNLEGIDSVSLNVSPVVTDLDVWDIVFDSTYNKLWRITNVNPFKDRNRRNLGWDCNARLVQAYEPFANLPRREAKLRKAVAFNRRTIR